jgi:hypothetical protein
VDPMLTLGFATDLPGDFPGGFEELSKWEINSGK